MSLLSLSITAAPLHSAVKTAESLKPVPSQKNSTSASGNDKLLVEAKKAEDAIFCSSAPKFGSADFRIISFNDILLRLEKLKTL